MKIKSLVKIATAGLLFASMTLSATTLALNPSHPDQYVVKKGDTLWDISETFLKSPWKWPELWGHNDQIENPHLIYPGEILYLTYNKDGQPRLSRDKPGNTVKLSPQINVTKRDEAIPVIDMSVIQSFLSETRLIGAEVLEDAPYIASTGDRLIAGQNDTVYVRGEIEDGLYDVFTVGTEYKNEDGEVLGVEARIKGSAKYSGTSESLFLNKTNREVNVGDKLLAHIDVATLDFVPHASERVIKSKVIDLFDSVSFSGQFEIIVIDAGLREGIEAGHALILYRTGDLAFDSVKGEEFTLPDRVIAQAIVFNTFDKLSYALIMHAFEPVTRFDAVVTAQEEGRD